MRQSVDGVNTVRERKEIDNLMVRDFVAALAVVTKPIEGCTEFPLIEADEPAVIDRDKRGRPAKPPGLWSETRLVGALFGDFVAQLCVRLAIFGEDTPFVFRVVRSVRPC